MKIGFDAKRAFTNGSGLGNYSRSTIELLTKYGGQHDYFLYTPKLSSQLNYSPPDKANICLPNGSINNLFKSYWRSFRLSADIKRDKLDVFHGLSNELPHNVSKTGTKSIVTIHDLIFLRYPELYKTTDRQIYFQKFKYACSQANIIIAISEQTKTDIVQYFGTNPDKIHVVYQGCNPLYYADVVPPKKIEVSQKYDLPSKYMLYLGTIEKRKNAKFIVETIKEHDLSLPLVIVGGKTGYQAEIEKYIVENNLHKKVFIHNDVPFIDLPALYQQATVFIYPSIFEGFGIPILEALNSKVPVITTKGGCFSEAGGMSSVYVSPTNKDELAEAITSVTSDVELRTKMIRKGLKYALNFREEKIAEKLLAIYLS